MKREDAWGVFLFKKLKLHRFAGKDERTQQYVEQLYPRQDKETLIQILWGRRLITLIGILLLAVVAWIYCFTDEPESTLLKEDGYIERQAEDTILEMTVEGVKGERVWEKDISINVKRKKFTKEEMQKLEEEVGKYLEETLLGENESLEQVKSPLNFVTEMPESEVVIGWTWDEEFLKSSGAVRASKIPPEGIDTEIMAEAECRNWKQKFYFAIHLMPPQYTEEELEIQAVKQALKQTLNEQGEEAVVVLPESVGDVEVSYGVEGEKSYLLVYLVLAMIFVMPFFWQEQQKKKMLEREEQLMLDYSGIVNKTMLLLSAGLTVRKTMERLATEYEESRKKGEPTRYVYEEICIMTQEMRDGISEGTAMERFGKRCRLLPYLRFSAIITQNLKKGAGGILEILENESLEALEERKNHALQLGEKAGTKLIFPMLIMLGLVMGIIMIPAFMTM